MMSQKQWDPWSPGTGNPGPSRAGGSASGGVRGGVDTLVEEGFWRVMENDFGRGLSSFSAALHQDPANHEALYGSAFCLMKLERYEEADRVLATGLALYPESRDLLEELGVLYHLKKQYGKAVRTFDRALTLSGTNDEITRWKMESLYRMGLTSYDRGDYARALETFNDVLTVDSLHGDAKAGKVATLLAQGRRDEALALADHSLAVIPDSPALQYLRGWLYLDDNRPDLAEVFFDRAAALAPRWPEPVLARAEALERLHRGYEAVPLLRSLAVAHPDRPALRAQLGWYYLRRHDSARARRVFLEIMEKADDPLPGINGLAAVYIATGKIDEAHRIYQTIVEREPDDPYHLALLAGLITRAGDTSSLAEARQMALRSLERDPGCVHAYTVLGVIASLQEHYNDAEEFFLHAIQLRPRGEGHRLLGTLYASTGRHREAREELAKAVRVHRYDTRALLADGAMALQEGKVHQAAALFRRAEASDPAAADPPRALAAALAASEDPRGAEEVLRRGLSRLDGDRRIPLLLALADLLMEQGDRAADPGRYREGLALLEGAPPSAHGAPDIRFREGLLHARLGDIPAAVVSFRACLRGEGLERFAERNLRLLSDAASRTGIRGQVRNAGRIAVAGISAVQLAALWGLFFTGRVSEASVMVLSPALTVLTAAALLLPAGGEGEAVPSPPPDLSLPRRPLLFPPEWEAPLVWPMPVRPALRH